MPLVRLKDEYLEQQDGVRFLMADELGNTVACKVSHEALRAHAERVHFSGNDSAEVLALRWQNVDLQKGTLEVTQAAEVVGGKLGVKRPKTDRSARTIKMPSALVSQLERHRKEQLEQRLRLGLGGRSELVFTSPLGEMLRPDSVSEAFVNKVADAGLKPITFHGLRHTHITLLLKSGVPVHVVSARAGHAKPSITLDTYSHLLGGEDNDAAKQSEEILGRVLK